mmetsp:Transcript_25543/g.37594  ORF Transcript_25543/g.37594 Transcript_25543/m.37594 type:complete len:89 (+) Transcript_25543:119-385(+)
MDTTFFSIISGSRSNCYSLNEQHTLMQYLLIKSNRVFLPSQFLLRICFAPTIFVFHRNHPTKFDILKAKIIWKQAGGSTPTTVTNFIE